MICWPEKKTFDLEDRQSGEWRDWELGAVVRKGHLLPERGQS